MEDRRGCGTPAESALRNTDYYGKRGATWSSQTVSAFGVRLLESGSCFDTTGSSFFLRDDNAGDQNSDLSKAMGLLNAPAFGLLFRSMQPGVHFGEGYLESLPFPPLDTLPEAMAHLARQCIETLRLPLVGSIKLRRRVPFDSQSTAQ